MLNCHSCFRKHIQSFLHYSIQTRANHALATSSALPRTNTYHPSSQSGYAAFREEWLRSRGQTPAHKLKERKELGAKDRAIKKHLVYLKDPLKLSNDIRNTLRQGKFDEAQDVVRAASKDTQCVVSWNHLIDWQMSRGKVNGAVQTYNEVRTCPRCFLQVLWS